MPYPSRSVPSLMPSCRCIECSMGIGNCRQCRRFAHMALIVFSIMARNHIPPLSLKHSELNPYLGYSALKDFVDAATTLMEQMDVPTRKLISRRTKASGTASKFSKSINALLQDHQIKANRMRSFQSDILVLLAADEFSFG